MLVLHWRHCVLHGTQLLKLSFTSSVDLVLLRSLSASAFRHERNRYDLKRRNPVHQNFLLRRCLFMTQFQCRCPPPADEGKAADPPSPSVTAAGDPPLPADARKSAAAAVAGAAASATAAAAAAAESTKAEGSMLNKIPVSEIVVKVSPTSKARKKTDFTTSYTANIYIPHPRAMNEYLLESNELDALPKFIRRSPYPERDNITVFRRRDIEQRAVEKWGSLENIQLQKDLRVAYEKEVHAVRFPRLHAQKQYFRDHPNGLKEKPYIFTAPPPISTVDISAGGKGPNVSAKTSLVQHGFGRVVLYAIAVNTVNCVLKFAAWLFTGSHSMFSEFIHSLADTANQLILAAGIHQSLKQPDLEHPYGWATFRNVSSLISGVGIFCVGAGLSYYHGIMGLIDPNAHSESLFWALAILGGSFISEGATLLVAINEVRQSCKAAKMTFVQYVFTGRDPSTNVVLLEDMGAIIGVSIAAACISLTHYTGNPLPDAVGSLLIGTLLGGVASFIIYTNTMTLVGRSIPLDKKQEMMRELESDRMIRTLHDVKATDIGGRFVRFKAEVDFDGREITRYYLEQQVDLEKVLQEMQNMTTLEDAESFMLKHGESIVDTLGGEVDRIEKNLKKKHPEIRHCDLEQL